MKERDFFSRKTAELGIGETCRIADGETVKIVSMREEHGQHVYTGHVLMADGRVKLMLPDFSDYYMGNEAPVPVTREFCGKQVLQGSGVE